MMPAEPVCMNQTADGVQSIGPQRETTVVVGVDVNAVSAKTLNDVAHRFIDPAKGLSVPPILGVLARLFVDASTLDLQHDKRLSDAALLENNLRRTLHPLATLRPRPRRGFGSLSLHVILLVEKAPAATPFRHALPVGHPAPLVVPGGQPSLMLLAPLDAVGRRVDGCTDRVRAFPRVGKPVAPQRPHDAVVDFDDTPAALVLVRPGKTRRELRRQLDAEMIVRPTAMLKLHPPKPTDRKETLALTAPDELRDGPAPTPLDITVHRPEVIVAVRGQCNRCPLTTVSTDKILEVRNNSRDVSLATNRTPGRPTPHPFQAHPDGRLRDTGTGVLSFQVKAGRSAAAVLTTWRGGAIAPLDVRPHTQSIGRYRKDKGIRAVHTVVQVRRPRVVFTPVNAG